MTERSIAVGAGATVGEVRASFAATWPALDLVLWDGSIEFYKEGQYPEYQVDDDEVVSAFDGQPHVVTITGTMTSADVRDAINRSFGYEPTISAAAPAQTLDDACATSPA